MFSAAYTRVSSWFSPKQFIADGGYSEIWHITWPLIIMNAANTVMMICNRMFLAHSSLEDFTAAVPAGQLFFCLMSFFILTCSFTATIVSQHFGAKDNSACVNAAWNGFYFGCGVSCLLVFLLPALGTWIIGSSEMPVDIRDREIEYFYTMTPCAGLACMETAFLSFFTGIGRTRIVASVKLLAVFVSVPLNYIFIFGKLGAPELGIVGAGLAASLASLFSFFVAAGSFIFFRKDGFRTFDNKNINLKMLKKLVCFGTPGGVQVLVRSSVWAVVIMMVGSLGKIPLAAISLAMTINMVAFIPLMGLSDAASVITGKYIGEGRMFIAGNVTWRALRLFFVFVIIWNLSYIFCPRLLINLFSSSGGSPEDFAQVASAVAGILLLQALQNCFDGTRFVVMGGLRGAGDTRVPLYLTIAAAWLIQLPAAYLLIKVYPCRVEVVWAGAIVFYTACDAALMLWRRNSGAWKGIRILDNPTPERDD